MQSQHWEMEAGGLAVQIHPQLYIELEASLGCMKPCLQTDKQGDEEQRDRAWDHLDILYPLALLEVEPMVFVFVFFGGVVHVNLKLSGIRRDLEEPNGIRWRRAIVLCCGFLSEEGSHSCPWQDSHPERKSRGCCPSCGVPAWLGNQKSWNVILPYGSVPTASAHC